MLNTYSNRWHEWDTIMLCKLGKPQYDVPNAYRPIALMNTMGKVLSTIVAEDLTYMLEEYLRVSPISEFQTELERHIVQTVIR